MAENSPTSIAEFSTRQDLSAKVLDSLSAKVAVVDSNGTIILTNEAWRRFAVENGGRSIATGVGINYFDVCRSVRGEDSYLAEQAYHGIQDVLEGERDTFELEYPCHSPTKKRWFLLHVSPLKSASKCAITAHLSITKRKSIENQLLDAERLDAIGQAMQGLSHEGRNSLQRAQGCIDLLRCQVEGDNEALRLVDRVENAQRQLISLYEEVRSYASPICLNRRPYVLNELVVKAWQSVVTTRTPVRFTHSPGSASLKCDLDLAAMDQVLRSVFENALATDLHELQINVSYVADTIADDPAITVIVDDNGPGIPKEDWEKVFAPFYTTKTQGTGLGLAMCKRIMEAHGGRIAIRSAPGGGTSVRLTLPRHDPDVH